MNHLGYCVIRDGEPVGLCPIGWVAAQNTVARYVERGPQHVFTIIPIYGGAPITAPLYSPEKVAV